MKHVSIFIMMLLVVCSGIGRTQQSNPAFAKPHSGVADARPTIQDPATETQVREYLRVSGEANKFRESWIAAVDKNRSIGEPYWPESFFQSVKAEMNKADLVPMFLTLFQHGVSRGLMQEVLDAYRRLGREHFQGSPECFKLGAAIDPLRGEMEQLKLAQTQAVFSKVYDQYKPQIKAARARYLAEHPDWKDK
jgi:hypothetical protein